MRQQPIGVFDSGIGGLTVVKALRNLLPREDILYVGDTARVPYGSKSPDTVERYSLEITEMLLAQDSKAIIVACNTASAVALRRLQENLHVPVVGVIEPGAAAAAASTRNGHIGVIGTRATIKSCAYERALRCRNRDLQVTSRPCPLLVPLIEEGWLTDDVTDRAIARYLAPLRDSEIDTLVLGCTHYPLLRAAFARFLGPEVQLVDSAENCARAVAEKIAAGEIPPAHQTHGQLSVVLTDKPDAFLEIARDSLALELGDILVRTPEDRAAQSPSVAGASSGVALRGLC